VDADEFKLGKLPAVTRSMAPMLANYCGAMLPPAPDSIDWSAGRSYWGIMRNNELGNCTAASAAHAVQVWTQAAQPEMHTPSDDEVTAFYAATTGYSPDNPLSDQGGVEDEVLHWWANGGHIGGHPLNGYARLNLNGGCIDELAALRDSIWLTGGAYLGMELPQTARRQSVWSCAPDGTPGAELGSWGGHCVYAVAYTPQVLTCITWGVLKSMTWDFVDKYCSEGYALLSKDWINGAGASPTGFDWPTLLADVQTLRG
jgi:hypothetical protein